MTEIGERGNQSFLRVFLPESRVGRRRGVSPEHRSEETGDFSFMSVTK